MVASSMNTAVRTMGTSLLQRVIESDSSIKVFDQFCQDITRGMQGILTRDKRVTKASCWSTFHDIRMMQLHRHWESLFSGCKAVASNNWLRYLQMNLMPCSMRVGTCHLN